MSEQWRVGFQKPVLAVVLAGGRGTRLRVLTDHRCKPEVPFGKNRLIDFTLATIINSQIVNHAMILTQYEQLGLIDHLNAFNLNASVWGKSVAIHPAQQRFDDDSWYGGTANAVHQNRDYIARDEADAVVIFAADHIYKLDIRQMLAFHQERNSRFTICGLPMPSSEAAGNFGVIELDASSRVVGFEEKPAHPKSIPGKDGVCFASMGIYMIEKSFLLELLQDDHENSHSKHDFGMNIIPKLASSGGEVYGYDYSNNIIPGEVRLVDGREEQVHYWRDVGRIGPYWESLMDIVGVVPQLNLYNPSWPVPTAWDKLPPAKFVTPNRHRHEEEFPCGERSMTDIVTAGGCIFDSPFRFHRTVFGRSVRTHYGAAIESSVVFDNAVIGAHTLIKNAIIEEGVIIPDGVRVGYDAEEDKHNHVFIDDRDHDPHAPYPPIRVVTSEARFRKI